MRRVRRESEETTEKRTGRKQKLHVGGNEIAAGGAAARERKREGRGRERETS